MPIVDLTPWNSEPNPGTITTTGMWHLPYRCPNCKCDNCAPKIYSENELKEAIRKAIETLNANKTS